VFLSLSVMIGAVLVGASVTVMVRRALAQIVADAAPPGTAADDEPHVKPTIWPLVFAVSSVALVVGIVANRWALIVGGAFFVAAAAGWIVDVRHQWHHHAHTSAAAAGHVPSQGGAHDGTDV
jgi:hypothetical protein